MNLPLNSTNLPLTHHMKFNKSALKFIESALKFNESAHKFNESALKFTKYAFVELRSRSGPGQVRVRKLRN